MLETVGFWHVAALNGIALGGAWALLRETQRRDAVRVRLAQIRQAGRELRHEDRVAQAQAPTTVLEGVVVPPRPVAAPRVEVGALPGVTTLDQVLATGWRPSADALLMALGPGGAPITTSLKHLVHVLMIGPTGVGKSNIARLLLPQIATLPGVDTEWWNPHYTPRDPDTGEEWAQMAAATRPGRALVQVGEIMAALEQLVFTELPARKTRYAAGQHPGPARFVLIDEVPVLSADKQFMEWIGYILREGRKFGLFVMMATQDALIKTLGGSTGLRANAQTVFYGGGDPHSARALLGFTPPDPPGQGVIYLKSHATPTAALVRVPWADNAGVRRLLGAAPGYQDGYPVATTPPPVEVATVGTPVATVATSEAAITAYLAFMAGDDAAKITKDRTGIDSSRGGAYQRANEETQQLIRAGARAFAAQRLEG